MKRGIFGMIGVALSLLIFFVIAESSSIDPDYKPDSSIGSFELSQNCPNPFNPITIIHYRLPQTSEVEIEVCDLCGNNITTIVTGKPAGVHIINFDGSHLASGIYLYRVRAGKFEGVKKMVLLR
jgi:hypothetical protein